MGAWQAAALATEFGFAVGGSLIGGIVAGQFVDRQLGTAPTMFLLGLVAGFAFSVYLIYVIYRVQVQPRAGRAGTPAASVDGQVNGRSAAKESEQGEHGSPR